MSANDTDPFQSLAHSDNSRTRRQVLGWSFVVLAVVAGAVFFFVRAITRTLDQEAVPSSYLAAIQQERFDAAYDLLCANVQERIAQAEFRSAASHDGLSGSRVTDVGRTTRFGEQRGPFRLVSYSYPVSGPELPAGTRIAVLLRVTGETDVCVAALESREAAPPGAG